MVRCMSCWRANITNSKWFLFFDSHNGVFHKLYHYLLVFQKNLRIWLMNESKKRDAIWCGKDQVIGITHITKAKRFRENDPEFGLFLLILALATSISTIKSPTWLQLCLRHGGIPFKTRQFCWKPETSSLPFPLGPFNPLLLFGGGCEEVALSHLIQFPLGTWFRKPSWRSSAKLRNFSEDEDLEEAFQKLTTSINDQIMGAELTREVEAALVRERQEPWRQACQPWNQHEHMIQHHVEDKCPFFGINLCKQLLC